MKQVLLLMNLATGSFLYAMNPHENCGLFFDFARTHYVPEPVVRKLFPESTPEQFIFLARALQKQVLPENQLLAMRIFLERNKLRHNRVLDNPVIIQQEIDCHRRLIGALAAVFSVHEYPVNLPIKPLYTLFDKPIDSRSLHYKLGKKTELDGDQVEMLLFEIRQAYDTPHVMQLPRARTEQ